MKEKLRRITELNRQRSSDVDIDNLAGRTKQNCIIYVEYTTDDKPDLLISSNKLDGNLIPYESNIINSKNDKFTRKVLRQGHNVLLNENYAELFIHKRIPFNNNNLKYLINIPLVMNLIMSNKCV
ncbi:hypothetical protein [Candidatus Nitrosocosmicus franklandus]|uniref:Uncharacterized protein n=1 Tax=Candidatus Nitrosocosmicus franklandianus TaxID=1798806 RepID=A0A484IGN0_9ARCH|nr:hypothetical protein [Candidatus Nitrosocosmicus franklandus]VFJ14814.1 protein of unknown function [Candidatus Nitrosocosmicus franklandus]